MPLFRTAVLCWRLGVQEYIPKTFGLRRKVIVTVGHEFELGHVRSSTVECTALCVRFGIVYMPTELTNVTENRAVGMIFLVSACVIGTHLVVGTVAVVDSSNDENVAVVDDNVVGGHVCGSYCYLDDGLRCCSLFLCRFMLCVLMTI